jgi:hypothetical protein
MARLRHPAMSAQSSLTGGKRTLLGHRQIDAFDPERTGYGSISRSVGSGSAPAAVSIAWT